ncbi:hypothetical protein K3495_g3433 [Podosphaera aphanis]|nr:hypothetical protein K3495_g3433 [Podosphaera aphanis]
MFYAIVPGRKCETGIGGSETDSVPRIVTPTVALYSANLGHPAFSQLKSHSIGGQAHLLRAPADSTLLTPTTPG